MGRQLIQVGVRESLFEDVICQPQPERISRNHPELGWGDDPIVEGMVCAKALKWVQC